MESFSPLEKLAFSFIVPVTTMVLRIIYFEYDNDSFTSVCVFSGSVMSNSLGPDDL